MVVLNRVGFYRIGTRFGCVAFACAFLLSLDGCRNCSQDDFVVAGRGRAADCRIVIPADGTPCHRTAAEELVRWTEAVSGVRLEIGTDAEPAGQGGRSRPDEVHAGVAGERWGRNLSGKCVSAETERTSDGRFRRNGPGGPLWCLRGSAALWEGGVLHACHYPLIKAFSEGSKMPKRVRGKWVRGSREI